MSILTHIHQSPDFLPAELDFLYTHRQSCAPLKQEIASNDANLFREPALFLRRLTSLFASEPFPQRPHDQNTYKLALFLTPPIDPEARQDGPKASGSEGEVAKQHGDEQTLIQYTTVRTKHRRISDADLMAPVRDMSEEQRKGVVAYVCGPPAMTDWAVRRLRGIQGVIRERVLCEKWW